MSALIWCPFPDEESAARVATALLDEKLIACAPQLPAFSRSDEERAKFEEVTRRVLAETDLGGSSPA